MRSSTPRFIVTRPAREDLLGIRAYVHDQSPQGAAMLGARFKQTFVKLANAPGIGRVHEEWAPPPYRFWPLYSYLIMYRADVKPLRIIRVFHAARDLGPLL